MIRRDFFRNSLVATAAAMSGWRLSKPYASAAAMGELPAAPGLTKYVSEFIVNLKYEDVPENVIALGKKTILDGFGLALAGSGSSIGPIIRRYVETLGCSEGETSVIGTLSLIHI